MDIHFVALGMRQVAAGRTGERERLSKRSLKSCALFRWVSAELDERPAWMGPRGVD